MTKLQRRQAPDAYDRDLSVKHKDNLEVSLPFNQIDRKLPKHGMLFGIDVEENGKCARTETNVLKMQVSMVDLIQQDTSIWYLNDQYQLGTARGYDSINVYDPNTGIVIVFPKFSDGTGSYLTCCEISENEIKDFEATNGNFLTDNMISQQKSVSLDVKPPENTPENNNNN
jgi:hypothetical protein